MICFSNLPFFNMLLKMTNKMFESMNRLNLCLRSTIFRSWSYDWIIPLMLPLAVLILLFVISISEITPFLNGIDWCDLFYNICIYIMLCEVNVRFRWTLDWVNVNKNKQSWSNIESHVAYFLSKANNVMVLLKLANEKHRVVGIIKCRLFTLQGSLVEQNPNIKK